MASSRLPSSEGELKQVTLLFADVSESTSLIEGLDPEDAEKRLAPALEAMKEAVRRFAGSVVRSEGDGIMAVFGTPNPQEDHAVCACCAGLALQASVKELPGETLRVRVGIHTGEVLARMVATDLSTDFDATGIAVNIARRLETLAPVGCIAISPATLRAARQFVSVDSMGERQIRGLSRPVEVFLLTGLRRGPTSLRFYSERERSAFTGREAELALLERGLARASDGDGCVIGIVAEAGVGKSRLCFEFAERCRAMNVPIHEGRALAHSRATPFMPIVEIVNALCGIEPEDAPEKARDKVATWLADVGPGLTSELPLMLDFLGIGATGAQRPKIDPTVNRERLNSLFRRLVRIAGADRPRIFLIEDLHWMDSGSESLIAVMVEALQANRILLIVNYRPGYSAPWMHGDRFDQVSLSPLRQAAADSLATQLLGDHQSVLQLLPIIADRANGNPLFIEELVRSFHDSGFLAGERGAYRLVHAPDMHRVPDTVQAIIGARIDSRPETEKSILQTAAVIGREFAMTLLSRLVGPLTSVENVLYRLSSAGLVYESATRAGVFAFRHPMVHDVAYRSLISERRRALHASIAAELEKTLPEANGAQSGFIAYHWEEAGNPMQAASFNMKAATWHGTRDSTQAIEAWKRVRRLLQSLNLQGQARYPLIMANGQIINLGWREGIAAAEVAPLYTEALEIAHSLGDMRAVTLLTLAYGRALAATGSAADYVTTATDVFSRLDDKRDSSLKVVGAAVLSHALRHAGQLQQALDANDLALEGLDRVSESDQQTLGFSVAVWVKAIRANILAMMDRIDEARSLADGLIAADDTTVDALHRMMAHFTYIDIAWGSGDAELAARHAAAVTQLADKSEAPYLQVYGRAYVGLARAIGGEHTAAARALSDNLAYARQRNAGLDIEPRMLADLAYVQLRAGLVTLARATAEEAANLARRRGAMVWLAYAELMMGGPQSATFAELVNMTGAKLLQRLPYPRG